VSSHYTVSSYHGPNVVQGKVCLGLDISAVSLSACKACKDTVFRQVTTEPFPVLSILSPHSEPDKLFKWCSPFLLLATCSTETLRYKVHWRNFADCTVCAQNLGTASIPVEVTRCLTGLTYGRLALTTPLHVNEQGKVTESCYEAVRLKTVDAYSLILTGMQLIKGNKLPSRRV